MSDRTTTIATCWLVTLTDATVMGFTDHDSDLTVAAQLYKSAVGYIPSAIQNTTELSPDNMDLMGIIDDDGIKEADLLAGKYDFATVQIFTVDYTDVASGAIQTLVKGKLGAVSVKQGQFNAELNNLAYQLHTNVGEAYSTLCPADLGDSRCGVSLVPTTWQASTAYEEGDEVSPSVYNGRLFVCTEDGTSDSGEPTWQLTLDAETPDNTVTWTAKEARSKTLTVTSVTDRLTFIDSPRSEVDGWFDGGLCTWTAGNNSGFSMDIKSYTQSTGTFVLYEPMPFDIEVDDTATITTGCDKTMATCRDDYDNIINFRGHPYIPGIQKLYGSQ